MYSDIFHINIYSPPVFTVNLKHVYNVHVTQIHFDTGSIHRCYYLCKFKNTPYNTLPLQQRYNVVAFTSFCHVNATPTTKLYLHKYAEIPNTRNYILHITTIIKMF